MRSWSRLWLLLLLLLLTVVDNASAPAGDAKVMAVEIVARPMCEAVVSQTKRRFTTGSSSGGGLQARTVEREMIPYNPEDTFVQCSSCVLRWMHTRLAKPKTRTNDALRRRAAHGRRAMAVVLFFPLPFLDRMITRVAALILCLWTNPTLFSFENLVRTRSYWLGEQLQVAAGYRWVRHSTSTSVLRAENKNKDTCRCKEPN
jgi:hypothetical protein